MVAGGGSILAAVGVAWGNAGQGASRRLADHAEGAVLGQQAFHAVEDRFVQGHVDHLAFAAGLAFVQRQQDADHAVQRGQRVADAHAHAHRHAAGLGGQVAQAAHGLGHNAEAGFVAVRPCLAVAADAQHDQARIELQQVLWPQAPAFHGARAEVLDQHVGINGQAAHDIARFGLLEIQRDRALVA